MKNPILEMQLLCIDWIRENHLEAEYNKFWASDDHRMPWTAMDFAIQYAINNREKFKGESEDV